MRGTLSFAAGIVVGGALLLPAFVFARTLTLTLGSSGSDVSALQRSLITKGYLSASATGYFGPATLAAVEKFQCDQKITCGGSSSGVVGPITQAALGLASGSSDTALSASVRLQSVLVGTQTPKATGKFEVSGWLPWYDAASSTSDVSPHLNSFTSVMPFGYSVNSDGTLKDNLQIAQGVWPQFIAQAHAAGVRVVPTIMWGNGTVEQAILTNASSRQALEQQIADTVKANGFDGIDIDFEAKTAETRDYYSTFLKGLYQRMGNKWVYCTVEARMPLSDRYLPEQTIPADATAFANDYTALNKYCDRVELMAYDQSTADKALNQNQTGPYAPVADPQWDTSVVKLAAQTIARNKLILGIPTYGYEYTVTPVTSTTTNYAYQYQTLWAFNPRYATDLASKLGISPIRNSAGELSFSYRSSGNYAPTGDENDVHPQSSFGNVPSISYTDGTSTQATAPSFNFIDWSDATAIEQKIALAKSLGLRGVAIFSLNGGEDQNIWNVLP